MDRARPARRALRRAGRLVAAATSRLRREPSGPGFRRLPYVLAIALLVLGTSASLLGGLAWASYVRAQGARTFDTMASTAAEALSVSLQRDADLTATARTLIETTPRLTNRQFSTWFHLLGARSSYPGSFGLLFVEHVPGATLARFSRQVAVDPPLGIQRVGPFRLTPPRRAAGYCLTRAGVVKVVPDIGLSLADLASLLSFTTPDLNYCALPIGRLLRSSARTDQPAVLPLASLLRQAPRGPGMPTIPSSLPTLLQRDGMLATISPVYVGGDPPGKAHQPPGALRGWVLAIYEADSLLFPLLEGHRGASAVLSYRNPSGSRIEVAAVGPLGHRALRRTFSLVATGHWQVTLSAPPPVSGLSATDQGIALAVAGALLSFLVFFLIRTLSRSRARALQLVEQRTAQLRHQALHDALTDLPNRELIFDRADQMLARARRDRTSLAALFVDLDDFKAVNDTLGHGAGDELLRQVAARLANAVHPTDTVGRLGGDEFVVLVELADGRTTAEETARKVLGSLEDPFHLGRGRTLNAVSASVGIAAGPRASADELLRDADVALHEAKGSGRGRYVVFDSAMQDAVATRLGLEADLRTAIEARELFLVYQPIFALDGPRVVGAEALLRWRHPTRGLVLPSEFIPTLEDTELILPAGQLVLEEACHQAARWARNGHPLYVSVNVSGRQLDRPDFVATVRHALERAGLEPRRLTLEITETALMRDTDLSAARLRELKALGVQLAIDDFGTGYCSLAYLQQFPVDSLKIDQSFVARMESSAESATLVHTIVQMGRDLNLETLAEGIETPRQLERLRSEACGKGQGFLLARPLEAAALSELLAGQEAAAELQPNAP